MGISVTLLAMVAVQVQCTVGSSNASSDVYGPDDLQEGRRGKT